MNVSSPDWDARVTKVLLLVLACLACALSTGCAFMDRDNRRVLNYLDAQAKDSWIAKTTAGRIVAAPVALPVGGVAFVLDVAVVQPAMAVPPAAKDTYDFLWKPRGMTPFRKAILFVPVVVATPIVFVSDWAFRSLFDVGDW